jgi:hypothetical protein
MASNIFNILQHTCICPCFCPCLIRASLLLTLQFRLVQLILDKKLKYTVRSNTGRLER